MIDEVEAHLVAGIGAETDSLRGRVLPLAARHDAVACLQVDGRVVDELALEVPAVEGDQVGLAAVRVDHLALEAAPDLVHMRPAGDDLHVLRHHAVAGGLSAAAARDLEARRPEGHLRHLGAGRVAVEDADRGAVRGVELLPVVVVDLHDERLPGGHPDAALREVQRAHPGRPRVERSGDVEAVEDPTGRGAGGGAQQHDVVHHSAVVDDRLDPPDEALTVGRGVEAEAAVVVVIGRHLVGRSPQIEELAVRRGLLGGAQHRRGRVETARVVRRHLVGLAAGGPVEHRLLLRGGRLSLPRGGHRAGLQLRDQQIHRTLARRARHQIVVRLERERRAELRHRSVAAAAARLDRRLHGVPLRAVGDAPLGVRVGVGRAIRVGPAHRAVRRRRCGG